MPVTGHSGLVACSRPGAVTARDRTAEVSGQDRGSNAVRGRAGQVARRTFPPFGYETAPGIGARPGLGLTVGQPRRNAPFLTHDHRCIPYGGIPGGPRRELNGLDSSLARRPAGTPPSDKRDIHLARPGYRAAITKTADRCTRDGTCNDPPSLSRTTGCPVCPGCGHPGTSTSVSREAAWVQSLEISVPGCRLRAAWLLLRLRRGAGGWAWATGETRGMRDAYSVSKVRAAEAALMAQVPEGTLMQRAAAGLASVCAGLLRDSAGGVYGARVVVLAGTGDNGGDALYAGERLARRGASVTAVRAGERIHAEGASALVGAGGRVIAIEGEGKDGGIVSPGAWLGWFERKGKGSTPVGVSPLRSRMTRPSPSPAQRWDPAFHPIWLGSRSCVSYMHLAWFGCEDVCLFYLHAFLRLQITSPTLANRMYIVIKDPNRVGGNWPEGRLIRVPYLDPDIHSMSVANHIAGWVYQQYKSLVHASYPSNCWYALPLPISFPCYNHIDPAYRRSSPNYIYFSRLEEMAAFQRIILFLIALCAVLSVSAAPLVVDRVSQQPDRRHVISSERADRDLMMTSRVSNALRAVSLGFRGQTWYVAFIVLVVPA